MANYVQKFIRDLLCMGFKGAEYFSASWLHDNSLIMLTYGDIRFTLNLKDSMGRSLLYDILWELEPGHGLPDDKKGQDLFLAMWDVYYAAKRRWGSD